MDYRKYRHLFSTTLGAMLLGMLTFWFGMIWELYYADVIIAPFFRRGNWVVVLIYLVLTGLVFKAYRCTKFGYLKRSDLIYYQLIGVTIVANLIANFYFSWKIFDVDWFERAVASYGLESGVLATGLMLLRVVDPKFETTGQESVASAVSLLYPLAIPYVILMPMLSTKVNGWVLFAISAAIWAGFYIVARRCFWHSERKFTDILSSKSDAPKAQRS